MQSLFDTRNAVFEPEDVATLRDAFEAAKAEFGQALSPNTERKLTKVIINLARKEIKAGNQLVAQALVKEAVEFISQLRSAQWLA